MIPSTLLPLEPNAIDFSALMNITARPPLIFTRGDGSSLWDHEGKRYLDFIQGWAVNSLGHAPKLVADALATQAARLITPSPAYYNDVSLALARRLTEMSYFDRVFFANSGAEANEGAIKLARKYGALHKNGAYEIITFEGAFHGRTLATMSASGKPAFDALFNPKVPGFPRATLNDIASVERLIGANTVAIMVEPIQGEAGVWPASSAFLKELRELTREHGLLLIVDEIQTGVGRLGTMFGYEQSKIAPDIMTLGKGIAGGVPLAALLATEAVSCFAHGDQGGTFNGNPLMCAVGLAVVDHVNRPEFLNAVRDKGQLLASELQKVSARHGLGDIRGTGLLQALDLKRPIGQALVATAMADGLLLNSPRPDTLRLMPALNVSASEIAEMIALLDRALTKLGAARCVA